MSQNLPLKIVVPLEPVAAVRPKVTRWNTYYPGKYGQYLGELRSWLDVHLRQLDPVEALLEVTLDFELSRPKSHYGTGRNSAVVKPSAPQVPHQDIDNLAKGVLDGLSGRLYVDDKQVVRLVAAKRFGNGRVTVYVSESGGSG